MRNLFLLSLLFTGLILAIPLKASGNSCVYIEDEKVHLCYDNDTREFRVLYPEPNLFEALLHGFTEDTKYHTQVEFWPRLERWYDKWALREVGFDHTTTKNIVKNTSEYLVKRN